MTVEENLDVARDAIEAFNARDWKRFDELHAESVIVYAVGAPEPTKGRDPHRAYAETFIAAFPDLRFREERAFGEGDWVCQTFVATGTNRGALTMPGGREIPATNRSVRLKLCTIGKIEGGQITEEQHFWNVLDLLTQLGVAPGTG